MAGAGIAKILQNVVGSGAESTARETAQNAGSKVIEFMKKDWSNASTTGKAVRAGAVAIPAVGIATGHADTVIETPAKVAAAGVEVVDKGFDVLGDGVDVAGETVSTAASFIGDNAKWLLPVAGIAGAGLLASKGGLGGIAKFGLVAGAAFMGLNTLKNMQSTATTEASVFDSASPSAEQTDKALTDQVVREKVDTANLVQTQTTSADYSFN